MKSCSLFEFILEKESKSKLVRACTVINVAFLCHVLLHFPAVDSVSKRVELWKKEETMAGITPATLEVHPRRTLTTKCQFLFLMMAKFPSYLQRQRKFYLVEKQVNWPREEKLTIKMPHVVTRARSVANQSNFPLPLFRKSAVLSLLVNRGKTIYFSVWWRGCEGSVISPPS